MNALAPLDYVPLCLGGIEVMVFGADGPTDKPLVIVMHGLTGTLYSDLFRCRDLAEAGFVAVAFDQRNHGRRLVDSRCHEYVTEASAVNLAGTVCGTAMDVSLLLDLLPLKAGIGTGPVGMTGFSLGGFATFAAMAFDPRIQVGAPFIASGHYRAHWEAMYRLEEEPKAPFEAYYPPDLDQRLGRFDLSAHPERLADRPILMLNGDADEIVPIEGNRAFERIARPHYKHPERLELRIWDGLGHEVPDDMWRAGIEWLAHWLQKA